jgi:GGDEF domain-containing protein
VIHPWSEESDRDPLQSSTTEISRSEAESRVDGGRSDSKTNPETNPEADLDSEVDSLPEVDFVNDGRIDRLTGVDAAEIFYLMLGREIAATERRMNQSLFLIRFTLVSGASIPHITTDLIRLAVILKKATRAEGLLSRLGLMTFVVVLRVDEDLDSDEKTQAGSRHRKYLAILQRYSNQIKSSLDSKASNLQEDFNLEDRGSNGPLTIRVSVATGSVSAYVDIAGTERTPGESLLDFLERAGV